MLKGNDQSIKVELRSNLEQYVEVVADQKAKTEAPDLDVCDTVQKIVGDLDPAGVDAELQDAAAEAQSPTWGCIFEGLADRSTPGTQCGSTIDRPQRRGGRDHCAACSACEAFLGPRRELLPLTKSWARFTVLRN